MARFDTYRVQLVQELDGVQMRNIINMQVVTETGPDMTDADIAEAALFGHEAMSLIQSDEVSHIATVTQQIYPVSKPTVVHAIDVQGQQGGSTMASRHCSIVRYYDIAYTRRKTYHLKIGGIPEDVTFGGRLENGYVLGYGDLITFLTDTQTVSAGVTSVVSPVARPPFDPPYIDILKANVNPVLTAVRSRQASFR